MNPNPRVFLASFALLAGACAAPKTPPPPVVELHTGPKASPLVAAAGEEGEILVWGKQGDASPRTYRLGPNGVVLSEAEGIVLATSRGTWRWETREEKVKTEPCDRGNGPEGEGGEGTVTRAFFVLEGANERQEVLVPEKPGDLNEIQHSVSVLGSAGPLVFVHESSYEYGCGAHGNTTADFSVWDVENGRSVDLLAEMPNVEALQRRGDKELDEQEFEPEEARKTYDPPDFVQLIPVYDARGRLSLDAQLARWACYACSDGQWSAYTRSVVYPSGWLPEKLKPFATSPATVEIFVEKREGFQLGGWSKR